jgi:hypothetical protein
MAETVRIDPAAHAALTDIARAERVSLTEALSRAIEEYRRKVFLDAVNASFANLRADARAWSEEQAEREAWDSTLGDDRE